MTDYGTIPATNIGPKPTLAWLPKATLSVDGRYQREISEKGRQVIGRIIEKFSWRKFGALLVTPAGEGHAIIDGQHRWLAAVAHPGIQEVPCVIVEADELLDQARTFVGVNTDRTGLNFFQLHHAGVIAGDHDALHLHEVVTEAGLVIPKNNLASSERKAKHMMSPKVVSDLLKQHGDRPVKTALKLLAEVARETGQPIRRTILVGTVDILVVRPDVDLERLKRSLLDRPHEKLEAAAKAFKAMFKGTSTQAIRASIAAVYNQRLDPAKHIPERIAA